jgi:NTP pyrophosphatase (non-canonical NTP hydrolase)
MTSETALVAAVEALSDRALEVRALYSEFERREYGHEWSASELMAGFVVDVGDLTRLVMASEGSRHVDDVEQRLAHELADCLWSVLVLGRRLGVDLGRSFVSTMNDLERHLTNRRPDGE